LLVSELCRNAVHVLAKDVKVESYPQQDNHNVGRSLQDNRNTGQFSHDYWLIIRAGGARVRFQ